VNRFGAIEADLVKISVSQRQVLLALLRDASLTLDGLLDSALADSDTAAMDLGEASQALHRALIALAAPGLRRPSDTCRFRLSLRPRTAPMARRPGRSVRVVKQTISLSPLPT
jgi:hypothetical protein